MDGCGGCGDVEEGRLQLIQVVDRRRDQFLELMTDSYKNLEKKIRKKGLLYFFNVLTIFFTLFL